MKIFDTLIYSDDDYKKDSKHSYRRNHEHVLIFLDDNGIDDSPFKKL